MCFCADVHPTSQDRRGGGGETRSSWGCPDVPPAGQRVPAAWPPHPAARPGGPPDHARSGEGLPAARGRWGLVHSAHTAGQQVPLLAETSVPPRLPASHRRCLSILCTGRGACLGFLFYVALVSHLTCSPGPRIRAPHLHTGLAEVPAEGTGDTHAAAGTHFFPGSRPSRLGPESLSPALPREQL